MAVTWVAHRGFPTRYPENTLIGFEAAYAAGAQWLETDVQFSQDGQPMLYHDGTLSRTSQQQGHPWQHDAQQLRQIGAAYVSKFDEQFVGEPIPRLEELIAWASPKPDVQLMIELKHQTLDQFGCEKTVDRVIEVIYPMRARCVLISKDDHSLRYASRTTDVRIGWVVPAWSAESQQLANEMQPDWMIVKAARVPGNEALWSGVWEWMVYPIDDIPSARTWVSRGVAFIETNDIGQLIESRLDS